MFLLFPYEVRTLTQRSPWTNIGLIAACLLIFAGFFFGFISEDLIDYFVLTNDNGWGVLTSGFMHGGWGHLFGNMIFLWVFGNALCGVMPWFLYLAIYLLLGAMADGIHLLIDGRPVIGASGAISGLLGVFLALYPLNRVHSFYLIFIKYGLWDVPGWLLLGLWFVLQLLSVWSGPGEIAYWAHIGGFVCGVGVGLLLTKLGLIDTGDYDNPSLLDLVTRNR